MATPSTRNNSDVLYTDALTHIVGGVNSPSRSFKAVGGGAPVYMERGDGAYFYDVDGNRYIDYFGGVRTDYHRPRPSAYP